MGEHKVRPYGLGAHAMGDLIKSKTFWIGVVSAIADGAMIATGNVGDGAELVNLDLLGIVRLEEQRENA